MSEAIIIKAALGLVVFAGATFSAWTMKEDERFYRFFVCMGWGAVCTKGVLVLFNAVLK